MQLVQSRFFARLCLRGRECVAFCVHFRQECDSNAPVVVCVDELVRERVLHLLTAREVVVAYDDTLRRHKPARNALIAVPNVHKRHAPRLWLHGASRLG